MKHLTNREEEIMERFWDRGALFVHDLIRDMAEAALQHRIDDRAGSGRKRFCRSRAFRDDLPLFSAPVARGVRPDVAAECGRQVFQSLLSLRLVHVRGGEENHSRGNQGTDPAGRSRISK